MRYLCFIISLCFSQLLSAQVDSVKYAAKLALIDHTRSYLRDSLHLKTGDDFYTRYQPGPGMLNYVYVSMKDTASSVIGAAWRFFGTDEKQAGAFADSCRKAGRAVMLYQTAGNSAAVLNDRLLSYEDVSLVFLLIHEAVHRHKHRSSSALPYEYEEALCDVIANRYCGKIAGVNSERFVAVNRKMFALLNSLNRRDADFKAAEKELKQIMKEGNDFQRDRYLYPLNYAYVLRYVSYARHYEALKEMMEKYPSLDSFLEKVMSFPADKETVQRMIDLQVR